jgi:heptosyltransferase-2
MKVLILINKVGLGDCILHINYIHEISKKYGKPVSILAKKNTRAKDLFLDDPHINEVITLDRLNSKFGSHDGFNGFFKLANDIKEKKFDKAFIFNSSIRYFLICKYAGIKKIAQYPLFKKKGQHIVNTAKIFTENELNKIVSTQPKLLISEEKILKARKDISRSHKNIVLGVSASGPTKRWGIKNFIKLVKKINEKYSSKFYLVAGKNDQELIDEILNSNIGSDCISLNNLKINEILPIIANCNLYCGNDTGFMHISAALNLKTVALFMDSPVLAYGKYSKNINVIIPEGETEETTTHDTLGADKISFDKVYNKCIELLTN